MNTAVTAGLPEGWLSVETNLKQPILDLLKSGETVVAYMISDIDRERFYRKTLLVITDQRFFSHSLTTGVQQWSLQEIDKLKTKDRGGLGTLELLAPDRRLSLWHYTIAQGPSALILGDRFDDLKLIRHAAITTDLEDIPEAEEHAAPPTTASLLRLWTFARPHMD